MGTDCTNLRWRRVLVSGALVLGLVSSSAVVLAGDDADASKGKASANKPEYLDAMIREAWDAAKIKPSPAAPDSEFMRRAYLDVLGRIPNVDEALAFLGNKDHGKRAKLIEYLLAHPDYGKNFGNVWTVMLIGRKRQERQVDRAALTTWLRHQFADNRPWNEIAFDLITAKGSNKENGAVNFPLAHLEFGAAPLTSITTRVFLGQQIQCTQCHDHPSNDWKQADFWGINAFYKGMRSRQVRKPNAAGALVNDHTELYDEPTDAWSAFDKRNGLVGIAFPTFLDGRKISQGPDVNRREALAKFITASENGNFSQAFVNRLWAHFMGRGFVSPVDDFGPHNPPSNPELLDRLASDFQANGYNIKDLIRWIMSSRAYNLSSISTKYNDKDESLFSHMTLKPMTPEQLFDSLLVATSAHKAGGGGDNDQRREAWMRQFVTTFATDEGTESTNFQGTIPQALMMMNGDLMARAVGGQPGSFLADVLEQARFQQQTPVDLFIVSRLYLAALSRYPSTSELANARRIFNSFPDTIPVMEDMFWALLNSNEFVLNR
jgi:Protein of unknown function (DUF1549)/Protein of unknown function (DUF1553)